MVWFLFYRVFRLGERFYGYWGGLLRKGWVEGVCRGVCGFG